MPGHRRELEGVEAVADRDPQIGPGHNYPAYDADYAAWLDAQVQALRDGRFDQLDLEHLVDEVSDLGKASYNAYVSALRIVLLHLLKWDSQEERRSRGWANSIDEHRNRIHDELDISPSYRVKTDAALAKAYRQARAEAAAETGLPLRTFPRSCPYSWEDIVTRPVVWGENEQMKSRS